MKHLHYGVNKPVHENLVWHGEPLCNPRLRGSAVTNDPQEVTCHQCKRVMQATVKAAYVAPTLTDAQKIVLLRRALQTMTDHASEAYPHFEDTRGPRDIEQARHALDRTK